MNIIKKKDFESDLNQLDYFIEQIKQLDYNNTQIFNEMIYMFHNYFSSLSVKFHEHFINYKLEKKLNHIDSEVEEGLKYCLSIIEMINEYFSEKFSQNLNLLKINFDNKTSLNFKYAEDDIKKNYDMLKLTHNNCLIMNLINIINSLKYYFKKNFDEDNKSHDCYI
jgi:arginyl-tRNA synthetase